MDHKCTFCEYASEKAYNLKRHVTRCHKTCDNQTGNEAIPPPETPEVIETSPTPEVTATPADVPAVATPSKTRGRPKGGKNKPKLPQATQEEQQQGQPATQGQNAEETEEEEGYGYRDAETGERLLVLSMHDFHQLYETIVASVLDAIYVRGIMPHPSRIPKPKNEDEKM